MKPEKHVNVWIQDRPGRSLTLEWSDPKSGKRRQRSSGTDDWKAAEEQRSALEYELNQGIYREPTKQTWEAFKKRLDDERLVHLRERAAEKVRTVIKAFDLHCSPAKLADVDDDMISRFAAKLRTERNLKGRPFAPWTIKNYLGALRSVLKWAASLKLIECPTFPPIRVPKRFPQPVPGEAFERLLNAMPSIEWKGLLLCGWWAGLRMNETLHLCRRPSGDDPYIDWESNAIMLPPPSNKSGDDQAVPMAKALRKALEAIPGDEDRIFNIISKKTGRTITRGGASENITYFAKRAGVKLSMHKLRKGFGSRLADRVTPQVLQRLMRHSDVKTTMDFYANVDQAAADAISGLEDDRTPNPRGARRGAAKSGRKAKRRVG